MESISFLHSAQNVSVAHRSQRLKRSQPQKTAAARYEDKTPSDGEVVPARDRGADAESRYKDLSVLVAGATGGVGRRVVERLAASAVPVTAFVRDVSKASGSLPSSDRGVQIVRGDVYDVRAVSQAVSCYGVNAVVCCTGSTDRLNPLAPFLVDYQGTLNLIAAARTAGVKKFVLVTSIGVDDILFPLNLFFGILFWKKQAELALQRSGIDHTIVRPGGLKDALQAGQSESQVVMEGPDSFGLPPRKLPGIILRSQVAAVCCEALVEPSATNKVVEIVAQPSAPLRSLAELFASVP